MNVEQKEELYSLECIYEGSKEVSLQLPDLDVQHTHEDGMVLNLKLATSARHKFEMQIELPQGYLEVDGKLPTCELTSDTLSRDQLGLLCEHLQAMTDSPVLFSWIEWLRTESNSFLHPPRTALSAPAIVRATSEGSLDIDLNDIPEDPPEAQSCANCVAPRPATVQLRTCGHWLCESCCSFTWQVYSVQLPQQPRCPLPNCQAMSTQLATLEGAMEPWLKVSQHILSSRFQDLMLN
eukprot:Skav217013  [mRNA]  locus=scaffold1803:212354:214490:- [translate_table: standard]